jgi:hypothetical protein
MALLTDQERADIDKKHEILEIVRDAKEESKKATGLRMSRGRPKRQPKRQPKLRRGFTGR